MVTEGGQIRKPENPYGSRKVDGVDRNDGDPLSPPLSLPLSLLSLIYLFFFYFPPVYKRGSPPRPPSIFHMDFCVSTHLVK